MILGSVWLDRCELLVSPPIFNSEAVGTLFNKIMIVTFDYDKTLTRSDVQEFFKELVSLGVDCYVLTYRYDRLHFHKYEGKYSPLNNIDLYETLDKLNCCKSRVIFTNCTDKSTYLNSCGNVMLHIDDDWRVMNDLTHNSKVIPIQVNSASYKKKVKRILGL